MASRDYDIIARISTLYQIAYNVILQASYNVILLGAIMSEYTGAGLFTTTSRETAAKARVFRRFASMRWRAGNWRTACIMTLYEIAYNVSVSNPQHQ